MQPNNPMKVKLRNTIVQSLTVETNGVSCEKKHVSIAHKAFFSTDEKNLFGIEFTLSIQVPDECLISLVYVGYFEADKDIEDYSSMSKFCDINAPAIAYPFLRAYVANLMLNSGLNPIMLPTINFVELAEKQKNKVENPSLQSTEPTN